MRYLVVIVCVVVASQSFGKKRSQSYKDFREIIDTFCHNHSLLGNTLLVLESGRMVISLAERLPISRIADIVADKIGLEIDDRGLVMSAIPGDISYYVRFEISNGKVYTHPQRYLTNDFVVGNKTQLLLFGGVIRKKRLELQQQFGRKFNMGEVSNRLGVSRNTLHSWETGRGFPSEQRLQELAQILSLEIGKLQILRTIGKKDIIAKETIEYLERQVRDEGITINEIETLPSFKDYLKTGIDLDSSLSKRLVGSNVSTRFNRYYSGEAIPNRRTVVKLAEILKVDPGLLWKALIRDKLATKFDRYDLVNHRHKFINPSVYEAFIKKAAGDNTPHSQQPILDVDKEMENFEITAIDILSYSQLFGTMLSEQLGIDGYSTASDLEMFVYRSGISAEKIGDFIDGVSLPNSSEIEIISNELLIEIEELYSSVQTEKFLDYCLEHLQAGGKLFSADNVVTEAVKEALEYRDRY